MSLCAHYLIRIKNTKGMMKIELETNYIHFRRILFCFYMTVTVRSTTFITDYVGMIGVLSPKVDL